MFKEADPVHKADIALLDLFAHYLHKSDFD